ncbi:MAG: T9SS type A sorting domain-containing protein, partial [Bacteroidota bacterium]|nr:T9SS type A sorting domain-containing protein [Bacteroidota bacterium]
NGISQSQFNDEMWNCAARFATWDIPAIKSYGASTITSRTQPKMNNMGSYVWRIDSTVCLENYGHNIIRLNAPLTAKTVTVNFEGEAGMAGFRKNYVSYAGWRYGFVALLKNGTRVYGDIKSASMSDNDGKGSLSFDCPATCDKLWLVVSGAPSVHWRHAWDDNDANDEQWPYQVSFNNTNLYGYANVVNAVDHSYEETLDVFTEGRTLFINDIPSVATVQIYNTLGRRLLEEKLNGTSFTTELPSGIFIISVRTGHGLYNRKIMIR